MPKSLWQIKWTDAAREDVLQIRLYLQEHFSAAYAAKITQEIRHEVSLLKQHPELGLLVDQLAVLGLTQYRQILAGQNRIIYEQRGQLLYIHLVCHTSMDFPALLARRPLL